MEKITIFVLMILRMKVEASNWRIKMITTAQVPHVRICLSTK